MKLLQVLEKILSVIRFWDFEFGSKSKIVGSVSRLHKAGQIRDLQNASQNRLVSLPPFSPSGGDAARLRWGSQPMDAQTNTSMAPTLATLTCLGSRKCSITRLQLQLSAKPTRLLFPTSYKTLGPLRQTLSFTSIPRVCIFPRNHKTQQRQ